MIEFNNVNLIYKNAELPALNKISLKVEEGEVLGLIGESGSGKSSLLLAAMNLVENVKELSGDVFIQGKSLKEMEKREYRELLWKDIAIVFQNQEGVLNPSLTIREQIMEVLVRDENLSKKSREERIHELFDMVDLDPVWLDALPRQLSGGMGQRVLIAMALALKPKILLIDEPTTSLEEINKKKIFALLNKLKAENITMIIASHDLLAIKELAERTIVMYKGFIVEEGNISNILNRAKHPYTKGLVQANSDVNPYMDLWGIRDSDLKVSSGCPFYGRCTQRLEACLAYKPKLKVSGDSRVACLRGGIVDILEGKDIRKTYSLKKEKIKALDQVDISIQHGEIAALIGQSGSGKTSLGQVLCGLIEKDSGMVIFRGKELPKNPMSKKNSIQIVFQDPLSSMNPDMSVKEVLLEPLKINNYLEDINDEVLYQKLNEVSLPGKKEFLNKLIKELSGGQRQRLAIGRALIMEPALLIADEITAMLDSSTKANVLRMLKGLQNKYGFSMLFITHDLILARKLSDSVHVMHKGKIVEYGSSNQVFNSPKHSYTKKLISTYLEEGL